MNLRASTGHHCHKCKSLSQITVTNTVTIQQGISGHMKSISLLAALSLVLFTGAANAEVLAVCGTSGGYSNASISTGLAEPETAVAAPLALWHYAQGFDVLLNWGERNQQSLRAAGADIIGN